MEPWYRFAVMVIRPALWLLFRHDFHGEDHLPPPGEGCIVAVNHISEIDPFEVALFLHKNKRRPRFLAKSALFTVPVVKQVLNGAKQIPVFRETSDAGKSLSAAVESLRNGQCVVVYPEATVTRDPDTWPMQAKTGVARLALTTGAKVIPIGQWGAQEVLPYHARKPHLFPRKTLRVAAGPPVDLSAWQGQELTAEVLRAATEKVMADVTALVAELRGEQAPATPYVPQRRSA